MGKRGSLPLRSHFRCALSPLLRGSPLKIPDFFLFFGNFLCDASSDFKEQLERDIAYAEITPALETAGCDQDDYKFKGLEAICSTNPADTERNAIVSAAVSFKTIESNPNTGVYKIRTTVSQNLPDILIRPKCLLLPAVLTHTPNTDTSPAAANIPIVITFNMPAEDKSTTSFSSLFNYTNISLKNGDTTFCIKYDLFFTKDGKHGNPLITEDEHTEKLRAIKLNYLNKQVYKNCNAVESNLTVSLTYNGNTRNMSLDSTKNRWTHTLENITDTSGLSLTLKVTDDLGNSTTKAFNFPQKPKCVFLQDDEA